MSAMVVGLSAIGIAATFAVASFTNVIIARLPRALATPNEFGELWDTNPWPDVLGGTSACGSCQAGVRPVDNVPVLSYLILGGRCRSCRTRIPVFHPLVEIAVPALAVAVVASRGWGWDLVPLLVAVPASVAIAAIDIRTMMVPTRLVWPTFGVVVASSLIVALSLDEWSLVKGALAGAVALSLPLALLWFALPGGMGFGDVRLSVLLGWVVGFAAAPLSISRTVLVAALILLLACVVSIVVAAVVGATHRKARVPFGPGLVIASWVLVVLASPVREMLV